MEFVFLVCLVSYELLLGVVLKTVFESSLVRPNSLYFSIRKLSYPVDVVLLSSHPNWSDLCKFWLQLVQTDFRKLKIIILYIM